MQFDDMGLMTGKVLFLLPGTAYDYQTNFRSVLDRLADKYHLVCVNYDGFDGSNLIFPDMITVTEKIEQYITDHFMIKRNRKRNAGTRRHSASLEVRWYIIRDALFRLISKVNIN